MGDSETSISLGGGAETEAAVRGLQSPPVPRRCVGAKEDPACRTRASERRVGAISLSRLRGGPRGGNGLPNIK